VLKSGHQADERLFEALKEHVKDHAGKWKYPRWFEVRADLPKTATGKIQRFKLREEDAATGATAGGAGQAAGPATAHGPELHGCRQEDRGGVARASARPRAYPRAAARGPRLRCNVERGSGTACGADRVRRARLLALRLRPVGSGRAAAAADLHARGGARGPPRGGPFGRRGAGAFSSPSRLPPSPPPPHPPH